MADPLEALKRVGPWENFRSMLRKALREKKGKSLGCHHPLGRRSLLGHEKRQVFDLPDLQLRVTEHQAEIRFCPFCRCRVTAPFPSQAPAPAQYGHRLMAWWTHLRVQQSLPLERIAQMTFDLFGTGFQRPPFRKSSKPPPQSSKGSGPRPRAYSKKPNWPTLMRRACAWPANFTKKAAQ